MNRFQLGTLWGIPINLNMSFFLLLLTFVLWQGITGLGLLGLVFLGILLHELGHALTARRYGIPILGIDLHFFGGTAKIAQMPDSPRQEMLIAAAGPAVSFMLALISYGLFVVSGTSVFASWALINLILGGFNLLPALPMDGGRILRAILARRLGRLRATLISVKVARIIAMALGLWALVQLNFFLVGLAVMLWFMAGAELLAARFWSQMAGMNSEGQHESMAGVEVLDRNKKPVNSPGSSFFDGFAASAPPPQTRPRGRVIQSQDGQFFFYIVDR